MKFITFIFFLLIKIVSASESSPEYQAQMQMENYLDKTIEEEFCSKSSQNQQQIISNLSSQAQHAQHINQETENKQFYNAFEYLPQESAYKLAVIHASSLCKEADYKKAAFYIQKALIKPDAHFAYGMILIKQKKEWSKAYEYFFNSGEFGVKQGYYNAAVMLYKRNAKKYHKTIFTLLRKSAKLHYERALQDLAILSLEHNKENIIYSFYHNNIKQPTVYENYEQILKYLSKKGNSYAHYNQAVYLYKNHKPTKEIVLHISEAHSNAFPDKKNFIKLIRSKQNKEKKINAFFDVEFANSMDVEKYGRSLNPRNVLR